MKKFQRRDFLKTFSTVGLVGGAASLAGCKIRFQQDSDSTIANGKTYHWRMVTTWQPHFPVLGEGAELIAKWIEDMSGGRLKIQVFGGGELVPPLEVFDAVRQGTAEMGHGAAYYWAGKNPAAQLFGAVPFGMNAQQVNSWMYSGGGLSLWEELYAQYNLIPFPGGNTGVQMGGWFNKEINSVADLKGLIMRIPGLGGKVFSKAGGTAVSSPGSEIYTNLERGVIDATEWIGPYHDYLMEFHKIAKYYYYPGWHEPGSVLELIVNKTAFEELPSDLQEIVRTAAAKANMWMLSEFEQKNALYLKKITEESKIQLRKFPDEVIEVFREKTKEAIEEIISVDAFSKKVWESYSSFQKSMNLWADLTERTFYRDIEKSN